MKKYLFSAFLFLFTGPRGDAAFINDAAPEFSLSALDGKTTALSDFQGKVVFVNFWASWCPPCKQEFPELNELANEYKDLGLVVMGINLDKKPERIHTYLNKIKVRPDAMIILMDPRAEVVARYVARSMPSSFIIDHKGVIRFVHFGYSEKDPEKWREEINRLLAEGKK